MRSHRGDTSSDRSNGYCGIIPCFHTSSCIKDGILSASGIKTPTHKMLGMIELDTIGKLVAGFVLYLQSLPPKANEVSTWNPYRKDGEKRQAPISFLADDARICQVESKYTFTPEERRMLAEGRQGLGGVGVCCHFRSAYWRRKRGHGQDPDAKRTEHVRWAIVREDRREEQGGIPRGTEVTYGTTSTC
jgi:hypothetical protein